MDLNVPGAEEGRNRRIPSRPTSSMGSSAGEKTNQTPRHPKGHKVRELSEVWESMDSQDFLHLSDTLTLMDVWVQPSSVEEAKGAFANVTFKEMVAGPHIKHRFATCKMSLDDLTKMLYLNDCIQWDMQNLGHMEYDDWLNEKTAACVKVKGMEVGSNRAKLCNFILTEDRTFTFYPPCLHLRFGIFFRKTCYHSYKAVGETTKMVNPSMIKCCATKGSFEYILEARIFPLPDEWFDVSNSAAAATAAAAEEFPESQPL